MIELCLVEQWTAALGIPNFFMYIFVHLAETMEIVIILVPERIMVAKLVVPGTESAIMSLSYTILILNNFVLRNLVGVLINKYLIGID